MIAYGQLESPWPVPGSVLVIDDTAYFAAGRQSLADGGILIFAIQPSSGKIQWVRRLDSVPQQGFYECTALEFDNFDLLHREGDSVGMSRWVFDRKTGEMSLDRWAAFVRMNTGGGSVMAPRGCWSYAPRHQRRIASDTPLRPPVVFRDNVLYGCLHKSSTVYRRDFNLEGGEEFDATWMTGWAELTLSREGKMPWRNYRLAEKALESRAVRHRQRRLAVYRRDVAGGRSAPRGRIRRPTPRALDYRRASGRQPNLPRTALGRDGGRQRTTVLRGPRRATALLGAAVTGQAHLGKSHAETQRPQRRSGDLPLVLQWSNGSETWLAAETTRC